jgi:hypothetical protein
MTVRLAVSTTGTLAVCLLFAAIARGQNVMYYHPLAWSPVADVVSAASMAGGGNYGGSNGYNAPCDCPSCSGCDAGCDGGCDGGCGGGCDGCGGGNGEREAFQLFPELGCGISITGWVQAGYTNQSTLLFNKHPDKFNLNQAYLVAEKTAEADECQWDWGFRADVIYGVDAQDTQAFGNNPGNWDYLNGFDHGIYGWALPQAYLEVARGDLSVKVGHFYTLHGYEVVTAPGNFFYSHSFTMYNSEPFTHTGVLGTYGFSENLELYGGWTLGWDTGFDQFGTGNNFLGGFNYTMWEDISLIYILSVGDFGARGEDGYGHSVVVDMNLTERLEYVLQSDYVRTNTPGDFQYGINQYLFYTLNDCWKVGGRAEWWKAGGVSSYEVTGGVNWIPHANFRMRPEIRHQWTPATQYDETIFGIDAILTF